jgi:hypothetical protein
MNACVAQLAEHRSRKAGVGGSIPPASSIIAIPCQSARRHARRNARVAQQAEYLVGNEEVTGSNPVTGSMRHGASSMQQGVQLQACRCSSAGQSARLIPASSVVRIHPPIPSWDRSSIGSSRGLLILRLRVRIPPVPPSHASDP